MTFVTFDDVLPTLVRVSEGTPGFVDLNRCCVVRDLRGRVRLVVDPDVANNNLDTIALAGVLKSELGDYFVPPIWSTAANGKDEARLSREIFQAGRAARWEATYDDQLTGQTGVRARATWYKFERRLSKQEWLESNSTNTPWSLGDGRPGIVTFYSFKGGVGRTTTLISCAWQFARAGKRVVVIDLDLEAPGVGLALGAKAQRGVVDFLVDELATLRANLDGCYAPADALGQDKERVLVVPAGNLGPLYLEKLGRLDFVGANPDARHRQTGASPIEQALRALLLRLQGVRFADGKTADYIFIDARAGLHDLAGLSLHRLAHVDVLCGRTNEQTYLGLELSLATLVQRKGRENLQCVLVQTMVPPEGTGDANDQEAEFLDKGFSWFEKYVHTGDRANTVDKLDKTQQHWPSVIRYVEARGRYSTLESIEELMLAKDYRQLRERIEALCEPSEGDDE